MVLTSCSVLSPFLGAAVVRAEKDPLLPEEGKVS